ncbi:MAG TPA: polysaccharide deacetylase family protein [Acidisarcina sp.]
MFPEIAACVTGTTLGAGGYAYAAMWPTSQIFGRAIVAGGDANEIALTFDDGPNEPYTGRLLDLLARFEVRATFFMIGRFVRQRPDLVRQVRSAGHLIGNHTMTHPALVFRSPARVRAELAGCNASLEDALGEPVHYFRPPHGARRPDVLRQARQLGLVPVLWNATGFDWTEDADAARIEARLAGVIRRNRRRGRGSNLLLHDGGQVGIGQNRSATLAAVARLVPRLMAQGSRFVTVDAWGVP